MAKTCIKVTRFGTVDDEEYIVLYYFSQWALIKDDLLGLMFMYERDS